MWKVLGTLVILANTLQDGDTDRIRDAVNRGFSHYTDGEKALAIHDILSSYRTLSGEKVRTQAIDMIMSETRFAQRMFPGDDAYREIHKQNPQLEPLDVPPRYYRTDYDIAVRRIRAQLTLAAAGESRGQSVVDDLKTQVGVIAEQARQNLKARYQSPGMATMIDERVDELVGSLNNGVESPFFGYTRVLTSDEMSKIAVGLSEGAKAMEDHWLDSYEKGSLKSRRAGKEQGQSADSEGVRKVWTALGEALKGMRLVDRYQRIEVLELEDERIKNLREVNMWWGEAFKRLGGQYHKLLDPEGPPIRHDMPVKGPSAHEHPSRKPSESGREILPGSSTEPLRRNMDGESGGDGRDMSRTSLIRWILGGGLVLVALIVIGRRTIWPAR